MGVSPQFLPFLPSRKVFLPFSSPWQGRNTFLPGRKPTLLFHDYISQNERNPSYYTPSLRVVKGGGANIIDVLHLFSTWEHFAMFLCKLRSWGTSIYIIQQILDKTCHGWQIFYTYVTNTIIKHHVKKTGFL